MKFTIIFSEQIRKFLFQNDVNDLICGEINQDETMCEIAGI